MRVHLFNLWKDQNWVRCEYIVHVWQFTICKVGKDFPWNFWEIFITCCNFQVRIQLGGKD